MGSPRSTDMHTPGLQKTSTSVPELDRLSGLLSASIVQRDEDKIPLFLLKLWSIIEDPNFGDVIRWDPTGYSFHILDPYSFCRNVLPQYFKHNNLNSLIRQLNMYGFRKMTPIERSGLAHAESDQDHLEFSHPYFVRDHPELLVNIKRKSSTHKSPDVSAISFPTKDLTLILEEIRQLREKNRQMENKMNQMAKENQSVWQELSRVRQQHLKQQQVVNKLVQFLVALVQSAPQKRLGKRNLLAIDEIGGKRTRIITSNNLSEVLDHLQREISEGNANLPIFASRANNRGPIIADVTDEPDMNPVETSTASVSVGAGGAGNSAVQGKNVGNRNNNSVNSANLSINDICKNSSNFIRNQLSSSVSEEVTNQPRISASAQQVPAVVEKDGTYTAAVNNSFDPPALTLSPSIDRQITAELADYFTQQEQGIDNCRELLGAQWDLALGDLDEVTEQTEQQPKLLQNSQLMLEGSDPLLALSAPATPDLLTPNVSPTNNSLE
uniref:HSF_DOMAIN domain-containing protein n=1 Tax=Syphacia muris TaxID=451379 RepID=A0A0N5A8M8_9BILA